MKRVLSLAALFLCLFCYAEHEEHIWSEKQEDLDDQTERIIFEIKKRNAKKGDKAAETARARKGRFLERGRTAFALGMEVSAAAANPYFSLFDFFSPVLTVDLRKISKATPAEGFSTAAAAKAKLFLDIYIKQKHVFGFYTGTESLALVTVPKKLTDFAANGNSDGSGLTGSLSAQAYAFADMGLFYGAAVKAFKFRAGASYYVPVFYLDPHIGNYELVTDPVTGRLSVNGAVNLNVYTPFTFKEKGNIEKDIKTAFQKGGVDINFEGLYMFNPYVGLNFSLLHIPLLPAYMDRGYSITYSGNYGIKSITDYLNALLAKKPLSEVDPPGGNVSVTGPSTELKKKAVLRPFKISAGLDIYPFANNYLIISPSVGFHCLTPFYVDGGLKLESRFLKVFGLYYSMNREDRIWKNRVGFFIDVRLFRLETYAASAGTTFVSSFKTAGAEAGIKLVFGY